MKAALPGCEVTQPVAMTVTEVAPADLRADSGGDLVLSGSGLDPRLDFDARSGAVTVLSDDFTLLVDGRPYPVARIDSSHLVAQVGAAPAPFWADVDAPATLYAPTGAAIDLPGGIWLRADGPPGLTGLDPDSGSAAGGDTITVHGVGFESGAIVLVGGTPLLGASLIDDTAITGRLPAGSAGSAVDVIARNPGSPDYAIKVMGFRYLP